MKLHPRVKKEVDYRHTQKQTTRRIFASCPKFPCTSIYTFRESMQYPHHYTIPDQNNSSGSTMSSAPVPVGIYMLFFLLSLPFFHAARTALGCELSDQNALGAVYRGCYLVVQRRWIRTRPAGLDWWISVYPSLHLSLVSLCKSERNFIIPRTRALGLNRGVGASVYHCVVHRVLCCCKICCGCEGLRNSEDRTREAIC